MSTNQRWAFQKKFQRGEVVINTKRFMGYDVDDDGELVINEAEAQIVRRIFYLYLDGKGMHRIAKLLNEEGVPTVSNSKWHDTTVGHMLRNEKYKGAALLQKTYLHGVNGKRRLNQGEVAQYLIEDNHEPIVSKVVWQAVQDKLDSNTWKQGPNKHYLFTSMLRCRYCGSTLKRQVSYKKQIVWCCSKYIKEGKASCQGMRVPEKAIEDWRLKTPVTVIERNEYGQKHYSYSSQESAADSHPSASNQNKSGRLLSGVHRPRRTAIKL